jgi:hypothetical protein
MPDRRPPTASTPSCAASETHWLDRRRRTPSPCLRTSCERQIRRSARQRSTQRRDRTSLPRADEIVYEEIARRRVARASVGSDGGGHDVLDLLLDAGGPVSAATVDPSCPAQQDQVGDTEGAGAEGGLSDTELRDQVVSLVAAGYDTTSAAVGWAVHELVTRPERPFIGCCREPQPAVRGSR